MKSRRRKLVKRIRYTVPTPSQRRLQPHAADADYGGPWKASQTGSILKKWI